MPRHGESSSRLTLARGQAAAAKAVLAGAAAIVFVGTAVLARLSYGGHPKRPSSSLAAPERFVRIVRQDQLEAGLIGPTEAPPVAETGMS
jgi:hypothetical protein